MSENQVNKILIILEDKRQTFHVDKHPVELKIFCFSKRIGSDRNANRAALVYAGLSLFAFVIMVHLDTPGVHKFSSLPGTEQEWKSLIWVQEGATGERTRLV